MAEGKIRVKFEEKDSDKLISAIKALNVETKKLSGQSAKYEKQTKKTDKANINLRNNTNVLGSSFLGFGNILTSARAKLLLFAFAANQTSQVVNNLVRTNANIEDMGRAFNNLSDAAGLSSDTFDKLNQAVDGTVRKTNLMQQANNAMLLGIFESSDQMAEMFDVAQRLGQALGRTASESIESLVTGLGRQSKLMLDNLGIVFDTNQAYEEYAGKLGKTASALTDQEKKQAFVNKAVAIANDLVKQSGNEVLSTNAKLDQLSVSFENLQADIGEGLTPVVILAVENLTKLMDSIDPEEVKAYAVGFGAVVTAVGLYNIAIGIAKIKTVGFSKALTKTGFGALAVAAGLATGALFDYFNVFDDNLEKQEDFIKSNKLLKSSFDNLNKSISNGSIQSENFKSKVKEQAETFLKLNPTVEQLKNTLINLVDGAKDFKIGDKEFDRTPQTIQAIELALDNLRKPLNDLSFENIANFAFDQESETLLNDFFVKRHKMMIDNNELERSILQQAAIDTIEDETALRQTLLEINKHFDDMAANQSFANQVKSSKEMQDNIIAEINIRKESLRLQALEVGMRKEFADNPELLENMLREHEIRTKLFEINPELLNQYNEFKKQGLETPEWMQGIIDALRDEIIAREYLNEKKKEDVQLTKLASIEGLKATAMLLGAMGELAKKDKDTTILGMRLSAGATIASGIAGAAKAFQKEGVVGFLTGTAMLIQTMARVQTINAQIRSLQSEKFEQGGLVGGRRHSQGGTMIEAERGEFVMSRNAVSAIGVENLNRMNQGQSSGGGSINININGGMISPDFVENELAESIREAVRRGADFGIS